MFRRIASGYLVVGRTFGHWLGPALAVLAFFVLRAAVALGMAADHLFFRGFAEMEIRAPIIIAGNPRTGTTFLHRFLDQLGAGAGFPLYGMICPPLGLRILLEPVLPKLEKISPAKFHNVAAHKTSLGAIETDDAALFLHYVDGFFLYGFFLAFAERNLSRQVDPRLRRYTRRDVKWLDAIWRRNLAAQGKSRVLAKMFSAGARMEEIFEAFPDAKIIYLVRDPMSAIPSTLSLISDVLDARFGFWSLPSAVRARWVEHVYSGLIELMARFHCAWTARTLPDGQVLVVPYDRMMNDFESLMAEILDFVDIAVTPNMKTAIATQARNQRSYRSRHDYDLARFGLDAERIRRDCAFIYEYLEAPTASPWSR